MDDDRRDDRRDDGDGRNKGRDNRGGNKNKGGQQGRRYFADMDQNEELASSPDFRWRLAKTTSALLANALGRKAGMGVLSPFIAKAEGMLGSSSVGFLMALAAAGVQEPAFMKKIVAAWGLPRELNGLADEFIDDVFEGINMARFTKGSVKAQDVENVLNDNHRKFEAKVALVQIAPPKYDELVEQLDDAQRAQLTALLRQVQALDETAQKKFDVLKRRLTSKKLFLEILPMTAAQAIEHLELHLGKAKTEGAVEKVESAAKTAFTAIGKVADTVFGTKEENDKFCANMDEQIRAQEEELARARNRVA